MTAFVAGLTARTSAPLRKRNRAVLLLSVHTLVHITVYLVYFVA